MNVPPIAKVDYGTLRAFLNSDPDARWLLHSREEQHMSPVDTDTLMSDLETYFERAEDTGYLYIFTNEFPVADAVSEMADHDIPVLKTPDDLSAYTIRAGGNEYMYLSPSLDEAAGDTYLTVMVGD